MPFVLNMMHITTIVPKLIEWDSFFGRHLA
jgi:hypothetical protein